MTATPEELSLLRAVVAAASTALECDECRICKDDRARIHSALSALAVLEARDFGSAMSTALNGHFRPKRMCVVCNYREARVMMCSQCQCNYDEMVAKSDGTLSTVIEWAAKRARGFERDQEKP